MPNDPKILAELIAAERALFAAIQRRDRGLLERLVADDFVLRMPGSPDVDRVGFLAAFAAIPGELLAVEGAEIDARVLGPDVGLVTGVQIARVRLDGHELADRNAFADVFERRGGEWRLVYAFGVPAPAPASE
jgi:ketosteroid isomerase-like protein